MIPEEFTADNLSVYKHSVLGLASCWLPVFMQIVWTCQRLSLLLCLVINFIEAKCSVGFKDIKGSKSRGTLEGMKQSMKGLAN